MVPERYIRKQTLTTGERYITEELKNLENQIIGAQEKIVALEYDVFVKVRNTIEKSAKRLQTSASIISKTDVLCSLAKVAEEMNYCMPVVDNSDVIDIKEGRHPVIEKMLPAGDFVQNDAYLDSGENRLAHNHWTKYGWKVYIHEASSINYFNGSNRKLCTSKRGSHRSS